MAKFSKAVEKAQARRVFRAEARMNWSWDKLLKDVSLTVKQRVEEAAKHLETKIVQNISKAVVKEVVRRRSRETGRLRKKTVVTERSKKGEFPRADTTHLMKSIFSGVYSDGKDGWIGYVGTPLYYGLILEVSEELDRRYMTKTFEQELPAIEAILGSGATGELWTENGG